MDNIKDEIRKLVDNSLKTEITTTQFRNKNTGEVRTQIPLMSMGDWERVGKKTPKPKKPSSDAKFSEFLQYNIDMQNWKRSNW